MRKEEMNIVMPTVDLITEMESVDIVGGIGDITGNYVLARCPANGSCPTNGYCGAAYCVEGCKTTGFGGGD